MRATFRAVSCPSKEWARFLTLYPLCCDDMAPRYGSYVLYTESHSIIPRPSTFRLLHYWEINTLLVIYATWSLSICQRSLVYILTKRVISCGLGNVSLLERVSSKVCLVKAMVFPIVMYECESWTIKKAECWRIGAFELWCWRRLLRVPWIARSSKKSILKEISPAYSLEGLMLKLKIQYFGHLMPRTDSLEKDADGGKDWRQEEKGTTEDETVGWHHWLNGHEFEQAPGIGDGQGSLAFCSPWGHKESVTTEQQNWTK